MYIPIIDKKKYDIHVRRRNPNGPDTTDKATITEEEKTGQEKLKMKSDGEEFPKPSESKIETIDKPGNLQKIFGGHNFVKMVELVDEGDGSCSYLDLETTKNTGDGESGYVFESTAGDRLVETSRSISSQKYSQIFEEKDRSEMLLMGYLTVLALVTVGAMYFVTTGMEDTVAKAVGQGIEAGLSASESAQTATGGAP